MFLSYLFHSLLLTCFRDWETRPSWIIMCWHNTWYKLSLTSREIFKVFQFVIFAFVALFSVCYFCWTFNSFSLLILWNRFARIKLWNAVGCLYFACLEGRDHYKIFMFVGFEVKGRESDEFGGKKLVIPCLVYLVIMVLHEFVFKNMIVM